MNGEIKSNVKAGLVLTGIAGVGYGLGKGIEFVTKKVIAKVKERKAAKETEEEK